MNVRLATGPVSWGVDFPDTATNPPWPDVLDGIVAAGYPGLELGPVGYLPEDPAVLGHELEVRGLQAVGAFVFEPLHNPDHRAATLTAARRAGALAAAVGAHQLSIIDLVSPARNRTAGDPVLAPRLDRALRDAMLATIGEIARMAEGMGLVAAVHPHAGSYIEFLDEIDAVAAVAPLCLDTGHCAYAALDPAGLAERFGSRVVAWHFKDLDPERAREANGFWAAVRAGAFRPLGAGRVDFARLGQVLDGAGYDGWATVEQDRWPGGDPVNDLIASRRYLERVLGPQGGGA